ncbi:MAG: MotA/TolQ/ExbB proton channel family protein [Desulfobacter sp.]|nr:MotA/TolQ/ExbB proton channel family protein [Desulfobacter sp.]
MQIIGFLKTFIYLISSSLFLPVLLILSCLFVWMLVYSGQFFRQWLDRAKFKKKADDLPRMILSGQYKNNLPSTLIPIVTELESLKDKNNPIQVINFMRDAEHGMWTALDPLKILIRVGPGLGLIGTLIPMGTGLASLGQEDLGQLSQDLVVAFTTTVVGMALGLLSYFYFTIQRRWVEQDIKNMALAAELLTGDIICDEIS